MNYEFLDNVTKEIELKNISDRLEDTTLKASRRLSLEEDYVMLSKFGVTNGSSIWQAVGSFGESWTDPETGDKYKVYEDFGVRYATMYLMKRNEAGDIIGVNKDVYVSYTEQPQYTKKQVENATKKALENATKKALDNAIKKAKDIAIQEAKEEEQDFYDRNSDAATNRAIAGLDDTKDMHTKSSSGKNRRAINNQNTLLGITLGQDVNVEVAIQWKDLAGGSRQVSTQVRVRSGETIKQATERAIREEQAILKGDMVYDYELNIYYLGDLVSTKTGKAKKGDSITI